MLKKIFYWLFGCFRKECKWEIIETIRIYEDDFNVTVGRKYVMQCKTCGEIKFRRT